jgi:hypothetical protein
MERELSKLSIYLSTSTWEGLSMGVLHAMAMGKPLVLRRCTGNVDAVEHGRNGYLFDTIEQATDYVSRLAADPELREQMGKRSREIFLGRFTAARMVEQYHRLYHAILAGRASPAAVPQPAFDRAPAGARAPRRRRSHLPLPATDSRARQPHAEMLTGTR